MLWLALNSKKIIVLVILYSIANILSYYALARVDASVYTVLLQVKPKKLFSIVSIRDFSNLTIVIFYLKAQNLFHSCICSYVVGKKYLEYEMESIDATCHRMYIGGITNV